MKTADLREILEEHHRVASIAINRRIRGQLRVHCLIFSADFLSVRKDYFILTAYNPDREIASEFLKKIDKEWSREAFYSFEAMLKRLSYFDSDAGDRKAKRELRKWLKWKLRKTAPDETSMVETQTASRGLTPDGE